jgi:hypothetical protein
VRVPYVELDPSDVIAVTAHAGVDASVPGLGVRVAGGEHLFCTDATSSAKTAVFSV